MPIRLYFIFSLCSFLTCFNFIFSNPKEKHYASICAIFKNEATYLNEWIEYHRLIGIEHFYLYNHESQDSFMEIISPYIHEGIIDLMNISSYENESSHVGPQLRAYKDCLENYGKFNKWIAFIDIDEFILPISNENILEFLQPFDSRPEIGSIQINWQLFGTSFIPSWKKDDLVIEKFTLRASNDVKVVQPNNYVFKSIIRPEACKRMQSHFAQLYSNYDYYPDSVSIENRKNHGSRLENVKVDEIQINHYFTRDESFFRDIKLSQRNSIHRYREGFLENHVKAFNVQEDKKINKYLERLKLRLNRE